jgi:hypothetical protein
MSRRNLASEDAWAHLLKHEGNEDLLQVLRSTQGYESRDFLQDAADNHPNAKVRRMISARMNVVS